MADGAFRTPAPVNEAVRDYVPGGEQATTLTRQLADNMAQQREIAVNIGGEEVTTGRLEDCRPPHQHAHLLGQFHSAGAAEATQAIEAASRAYTEWSCMPWESRAAVFLKAADLLTGPYRDRINAATMLGQSKTVYQAEIDAACELADFWRFNVHYLTRMYADQPTSGAGIWNYVDYRPLEGFVLAVTPFNFTAIGANLATAPAIMGNTVLWKPAETQTYSAAVTMDVLHEAGLPPGVINFLPGDGPAIGKVALAHPDLAGIHFTGSTATFQHLWSEVGRNIHQYRAYPRLVGETGGKDFVFAHPSANVDALVTGLVRGAFEFQGQKCSAASRAFIPSGLWDEVMARLEAVVGSIKMGSPTDFSNFMGAVIDARSFAKISDYLAYARDADDHQIVIGGGVDDSVGYFVEPTVVVADSPHARLMTEEIFGPVLTIYRYEEAQMEATLDALDSASPYALTGAIFCQDRRHIKHLSERLRFSAGNFYINDKPTGAVVGQQPFGGARGSGTDDKAGSSLNLLRWVAPRTIKETYDPPRDWRYPHMG